LSGGKSTAETEDERRETWKIWMGEERASQLTNQERINKQDLEVGELIQFGQRQGVPFALSYSFRLFAECVLFCFSCESVPPT